MISIIIPVYNVQDYIFECLQSVANQSYLDSLECVIIDDCGQDNSISLAMDFIDNYSGSISFRIVHHSQNKGLSGARNTGIREAKGDYVYFLDSDDTIYPTCIEEMSRLVYEHPGVDIVQGNFVIEESGTRELATEFPSYTNDVNWIRTSLCSFSIAESACNRLVRKAFIVDNGIFFKEGWIQEDTEWTFQIQKCIKSFAFTNKESYYYRTNPDGIMHSSGKMKEAMAYAKIYNHCYSELLQCEVVYPFEIHYIAILSQRIYDAIGEVGYDMLLTKNNLYFKRLSAVMKSRKNILGFIERGIKRRLCSYLERLLCNPEKLGKN